MAGSHIKVNGTRLLCPLCPHPCQTHQLVLDGRVPQTQAVEVMQQVLVDDGELPRQHSAHVDVGGVRLKALVVTQDLLIHKRREMEQGVRIGVYWFVTILTHG